ncbi:MAG: hypothetical protein HRT47_03735 [Candidatus Caenarcaniphilales bacterium]|nr:hypothetical protein [Candidatus Caenarcaniphilales bacterium]
MNQKDQRELLGYSSNIASFIIVVLSIFDWISREILTTIFVGLFYLLIVYVPILMIIIWSFVYGFKNRKTKQIKSWTPFLTNMVAIILVLIMNYFHIGRIVNFYLNLNTRNEVINKVKNKELEVNSHGTYFTLRDKNKISQGKVIIGKFINNEMNMLFHYFDQSPFIHSFSGYLYASNNKFENINFIQCYGKIEKYKIKDNWYWVSCLDYREY